jgi:uncharacterized membrane protein YedE/YeeE
MKELILGLVTGVLFGALLQQGRVLRFEKQVGAMLLKDMTILKFMLSAIIVGMIGIHLLVDMGQVKMSIKGTFVVANLIGGILFGVGWAVAGYCPGTSVGAIGEGRWHAIWAVLGMLAGAAVYAEAYPLLKDSVLTWGDLGKATLPSVTGIHHWVWIVLLSAMFVALFAWFEKKKL